MTTLKGSKKEGAKIVETKTWGLHVIDYVNLYEGRPVSRTFPTMESAEKEFEKIIAQKLGKSE